MSDEMVIRHGSPTLAGLKTGNLFSCTYTGKTQLQKALRSLNRRLSSKGVRIVPLRVTEKTALLYLYRPGKLKEDFAVREAAEILEEYGYAADAPDKCIVRLSRRLKGSDRFPHEIGLFLGYPPEDVKGFIENRAEGYKCSGCWKVYGNEQEAKCRFERFWRCTSIYCSQWSRGKSIECLTVAAGS